MEWQSTTTTASSMSGANGGRRRPTTAVLLLAAFTVVLLTLSTVNKDDNAGFAPTGFAAENTISRRMRRFGLPVCEANSTGGEKWAVPDNVSVEGERKTFVSMAVCWDGNTRLHHKADFPYRLATRLSVKLWKSKTPYIPLVQVVHGPEMSGELTAFVQGLQEDGAVVRTVETGEMDCPLKAQLIRLLAFQDAAVGEGDVVVMADVDAFVVRPDIFPDMAGDHAKLMWLFQYGESLRHDSTFSMSFVGAPSAVWRAVLGGADSPEALVAAHACALNLHFRSQWDYDQLILTRAVLRSGLCRLPPESRLWDTVRLDPESLTDLTEAEARASAAQKELQPLRGSRKRGGGKAVPKGRMLSTLLRQHVNKLLFNQDVATAAEEEGVRDDASVMASLGADRCFYGLEWSNCNKGRATVDGGCKWWHFYPNERERDLMRKYYEIAD